MSLRLSFEGLLCSLPLESTITLEQGWPWTQLDLGYYTATGPPIAIRPEASISSFVDWAYYDPFLPPKLLGRPKEIAMTRPAAHCLAHVRHLIHHGTSLCTLPATHHGILVCPRRGCRTPACCLHRLLCLWLTPGTLWPKAGGRPRAADSTEKRRCALWPH